MHLKGTEKSIKVASVCLARLVSNKDFYPEVAQVAAPDRPGKLLPPVIFVQPTSLLTAVPPKKQIKR